MKLYEALFIFSTETAAQENIAAEVTGWIQRFEGVVDQVTELGSRRLGYKIGKSTEGRAFAVQYQMNPAQVEPFRKILLLEGKLLAFTITFPASKKPVPKFFKADEADYAGAGAGYGRRD